MEPEVTRRSLKSERKAVLSALRKRLWKRRSGLAAGSTVLALAASLFIGVSPASATHPTLTGSADCVPVGGSTNITWTVGGDPGYARETATVKEQSAPTTPTLVGVQVKGTQTFSTTQAITEPGTYELQVFVQWTNHREGDLVSQKAKVTVKQCAPVKDATAAVSVTPATCEAPAKLVYGEITNATFSGTPNGTTGPGSYNTTATANAGHKMTDGKDSWNFTGTLADKLPAQSSDPYKPCYNAPPPPTQGVSCEAITADYHRPLTNGDHINVTIEQDGTVLGQVNMYVDQNVAGGASYNGQNNLGLRWKILGVEQTPIPLSLDQVLSGVVTFNYGTALGQQNITFWTVTFVQTNSTDTWPNKECGTPPEEPKQDASGFISVTPATCEAPAKLVYGEITNATFSGTPNGTTGPGSYNVVVTPDVGHLMTDGKDKWELDGDLSGPLPSQSTNPNGECFVPQTTTGSLTFQTASCVEGSKNWATGEGVPGGIFVFEDENGKTFETEIGEGYDGGIPEGLAYETITVSLKDGDAQDQYEVTPWSGDWTTVDPESLDCRVENAKAWVEVTGQPTCDAPAKTQFFVENAIWDDEILPGEEPNTFVRGATAAEGSKFSNGTDRLLVTYTVPQALGYQSEDPEAPCYEEPPALTPDPTPEPTATPTPTTMEQLPLTGGSSVWWLVAVGGLMIAAGAGIVIRRRRNA